MQSQTRVLAEVVLEFRVSLIDTSSAAVEFEELQILAASACRSLGLAKVRVLLGHAIGIYSTLFSTLRVFAAGSRAGSRGTCKPPLDN